MFRTGRNPAPINNAKEMWLSSPLGRIHKRLHHKHVQQTNLSPTLKPLTALVLRKSDFAAYPFFANNSLRAPYRRREKKKTNQKNPCGFFFNYPPKTPAAVNLHHCGLWSITCFKERDASC